MRPGQRRNYFGSISGWHLSRYAGVIIALLTSAKELRTAKQNCLHNKNANRNCLQKARSHCEQKFAYKLCSLTKSNLLREESEFLQNLSKQKSAYKICSQNLLTAKKNCSQRKTLPARMDQHHGSKCSHHANWSTVGGSNNA